LSSSSTAWAASLPHLALILEELQRQGVALIATSQGIDTSNSNPVGRLQLNVLMAVAEFEQEIIRERVNAGLAAARARGVKLGRRAGHRRTPPEVLALKARGLGVRAIARELKMPPSSVWVMLQAQPQAQAALRETRALGIRLLSKAFQGRRHGQPWPQRRVLRQEAARGLLRGRACPQERLSGLSRGLLRPATMSQRGKAIVRPAMVSLVIGT
jgi:hypothetical protein